MRKLEYGLLDDGTICDPSDPCCVGTDSMFISSYADSDNFSDTLVCCYLGNVFKPSEVRCTMTKYAYMFFDDFFPISAVQSDELLSYWADVWGCSVDSIKYLF